MDKRVACGWDQAFDEMRGVTLRKGGCGWLVVVWTKQKTCARDEQERGRKIHDEQFCVRGVTSGDDERLEQDI